MKHPSPPSRDWNPPVNRIHRSSNAPGGSSGACPQRWIHSTVPAILACCLWLLVPVSLAVDHGNAPAAKNPEDADPNRS